MAGRVRRNNDRGIFVAHGQLILKQGNNWDQRGSEKNDLTLGAIDDNTVTTWSRFHGGSRNDPANYDISDSIDPANDFPTV